MARKQFNARLALETLEEIARNSKGDRRDRENAYTDILRGASIENLKDIICLKWVSEQDAAGFLPNGKQLAEGLRKSDYHQKLTLGLFRRGKAIQAAITELEEELTELDPKNERIQRLNINAEDVQFMPPEPQVEEPEVSIEEEEPGMAEEELDEELGLELNAETPQSLIEKIKNWALEDQWVEAQLEGQDFHTLETNLANTAERKAAFFRLRNLANQKGLGPERLASTKFGGLGEQLGAVQGIQALPTGKELPKIPEAAGPSKRLYLWRDGKLIATWEREATIEITPENRTALIKECLESRNNKGITLKDRLIEGISDAGGGRIKIDENELDSFKISNIYPGVKSGMGREELDLTDLIRFQEGKGNERIHQRRDVIETVRRGTTDMDVARAITVCRAFAKSVNEYKIEDKNSLEYKKLSDVELIGVGDKKVEALNKAGRTDKNLIQAINLIGESLQGRQARQEERQELLAQLWINQGRRQKDPKRSDEALIHNSKDFMGLDKAAWKVNPEMELDYLLSKEEPEQEKERIQKVTGEIQKTDAARKTIQESIGLEQSQNWTNEKLVQAAHAEMQNNPTEALREAYEQLKQRAELANEGRLEIAKALISHNPELANREELIQEEQEYASTLGENTVALQQTTERLKRLEHLQQLEESESLTRARELIRQSTVVPMDTRTAIEIIRNQKSDTEDTKGWTADQMSEFVGECLRQSETAEEQIEFLRTYSHWIDAENNPQQQERLRDMKGILAVNQLGMIDRLGDGENYEDMHWILNQLPQMKKNRVFGQVLKNSVISGNPIHGVRADLEKKNQRHGEPLNAKAPTTKENNLAAEAAQRQRYVGLINGEIQYDPKGEAYWNNLEEAAKFKAGQYRKFGKFLSENEKIKIARGTTKADGELLLAMAEDPLTRGKLRRYLIDNAPGGKLGETIQLTALRESLTEGRGEESEPAHTINGQHCKRLNNVNEQEAKTLIDLLRLEPRTAAVNEIAKELLTLDDRGEPKWKVWQKRLHEKGGADIWEQWTKALEAERVDKAKKAKWETAEVRVKLRNKPHISKDKKQVWYEMETMAGHRFRGVNFPRSEEEAKLAAAVHPGEELVVVTQPGNKGEAINLLKVQRIKKVHVNNEILTQGQQDSIWTEVGPAAIEHLNHYLEFSGELQELERLQAIVHAEAKKAPLEKQEATRTAAWNKIQEDLAGPKDDTGRRIGDKVGKLEFELEDNPDNPLPGTKEEQQALRRKLKGDWLDEHHEAIHGIRKPNGELMLDEDGTPVKAGFVDKTMNRLKKANLPSQIFTGVNNIKGADVSHQITVGTMDANRTIASFDTKQTNEEKWDAIDREIANANGGKLPKSMDKYIEARMRLLKKAMNANLDAVKANMRESSVHMDIKKAARTGVAAPAQKLLGMLGIGPTKEVAIENLGASLLR